MLLSEQRAKNPLVRNLRIVECGLGENIHGLATGGATLEDVALLRKHSPAHVQVKASGGIRDLNTFWPFETPAQPASAPLAPWKSWRSASCGTPRRINRHGLKSRRLHGCLRHHSHEGCLIRTDKWICAPCLRKMIAKQVQDARCRRQMAAQNHFGLDLAHFLNR